MAASPSSTSSITRLARLSKARLHEFTIHSKFALGYRNREDVTNLPPAVLSPGSQNVLTNVSGRVGTRLGYTLDGQANVTVSPIVSAFDWNRHTGDFRNLRAWGTSLQYRYVDGLGVVTWRDLLTGLTSVNFNFTDYWDFTNLQSLLLFVNGGSNIWEWTGGITTILSVTATTITKAGVETWAEIGFYTTGTHMVTINGVDYTATGGWGTTTLTGVSPNPVGSVNPGDIAHQTPEPTANSSMTGLPATLANSLIAVLRNQIYIGSLVNRTVYISKQNDYKDYTFSTPRVVGEGALVTLDDVPRAFVPQEDRMYTAAGLDQWYETRFTLSSDLADESFEIIRLKTTALQGVQNQSVVSKIPNDVVFISNEPIVRTLGRVTNILVTPQMVDLSNPIVNDMNQYDFTGASSFYFRNFIYIAIPENNVVLVYNMTNPKDHYWEAPQILPISRFAIINEELYGHSSQVPETYKLFTGTNDNGKAMEAKAVFSFENLGTRTILKNLNAFYTEGYISSNTMLGLTLQLDVDGCSTTIGFSMSGDNPIIVCLGGEDDSLGKNPLGKAPLGGAINLVPSTALPPKFRWWQTFNRSDFFERQVTLSSIGIDQNWEVLAFGGNDALSSTDTSVAGKTKS